MAHAKLSPSSAYRWLTCPGSIRMSEGIEDVSSAAAAEGTRAHELAEKMLNGELERVDIYPQEMLDHIEGYVDYVLSMPGKLFVEQRVSMEPWVPGGFGTADAIVIDGKTLHIVDLKYGLSWVGAEGNSQLMLYAAGAAARVPGARHIVMHIHQPRNGGARSHKMTAKALLKWAESVRPKAALCLEPDAPLSPSEAACKYCPAASSCPALRDHALAVVGGDFAELPDVDAMTPEQLSLVVTNKKLLINMISAMEERALYELERGTPIPGLKLVESVTRARYTDKAEKALGKILGEAAFKEPVLINMGDAKKLLGAKKFEDLGITEKPPGKPSVVPDSDRRPAITLTADDFSKLQNAKTEK